MNRVLISEQEEALEKSRFSRQHPVLSYVFGDMVKGLYLVGCLALDLFLPAQLRLSFPGQDAITLLSMTAIIIGLSYGEIRLYRRLWPSRRRNPTQVVEE